MNTTYIRNLYLYSLLNIPKQQTQVQQSQMQTQRKDLKAYRFFQAVTLAQKRELQKKQKKELIQWLQPTLPSKTILHKATLEQTVQILKRSEERRVGKA